MEHCTTGSLEEKESNAATLTDGLYLEPDKMSRNIQTPSRCRSQQRAAYSLHHAPLGESISTSHSHSVSLLDAFLAKTYPIIGMYVSEGLVGQWPPSRAECNQPSIAPSAIIVRAYILLFVSPGCSCRTLGFLDSEVGRRRLQFTARQTRDRGKPSLLTTRAIDSLPAAPPAKSPGIVPDRKSLQA
jgi:hypothetical protein